MGQKYKLTANDSFEFQFSREEIDSLDVQELSSGKFHLLSDHRSRMAEIPSSDFYRKTYSVKINSNTYNIVISDELDILIKEMGLSLGAENMISDILAPMPGLILSVNVKEGDTVKEGDYLLVLEAMKMENTIVAPRDAIVKSVKVIKGDTVTKNQIVIEME
ncbi:MAG TPA: acetyl-CoA carboxylase biotin carboxyl carrier protein subunit [Flavobacteriaceae bacterium]|nr:acetyl-CoA carboxylase biotin carboxyl carrier protein subunit [Flavobacteriaceae bacterium]